MTLDDSCITSSGKLFSTETDRSRAQGSKCAMEMKFKIPSKKTVPIPTLGDLNDGDYFIVIDHPVNRAMKPDPYTCYQGVLFRYRLHGTATELSAGDERRVWCAGIWERQGTALPPGSGHYPADGIQGMSMFLVPKLARVIPVFPRFNIEVEIPEGFEQVYLNSVC